MEVHNKAAIPEQFKIIILFPFTVRPLRLHRPRLRVRPAGHPARGDDRPHRRQRHHVLLLRGRGRRQGRHPGLLGGNPRDAVRVLQPG